LVVFIVRLNTNRTSSAIIARLEVTSTAGAVCVETYDEYNQLGRFTLRDQVSTLLGLGLGSDELGDHTNSNGLTLKAIG
jgi:hypothetical protein